jgi:hypothetical protein
MNGMATQEKRAPHPILVKILKRLLTLVVLGFAIGWTLNRAAIHFAGRPEPAGFWQGIVQGALMPIAMPNLIIGNDVAIYAANNNGRMYKLGYTAGVNGCGLIFFGFFFWRIRRMRLRSRNSSVAT